MRAAGGDINSSLTCVELASRALTSDLGPNVIHPADLTATDAARHIRNGSLTVSELIEACIERVDQVDVALKAFVHFDRDLVRRHAAEANRGPSKGPLHGLPIGVKDVLDTSDMPTGYGSQIWEGYRPRADAAVVATARSAGAIIFGKTATTEFATRRPSATLNPHNPNHTPGGSSSGSAAAVAARLCPFAFATQTAGSIIRPAAFCGIVGYKPSFGLIHRAGMKVMSETLDTIGVLARSVADCALLIGSLMGRDLGDPEKAPPRPPKFAMVFGPSTNATAETVTRIREIAETLRRSGAVVEEKRLPPETEEAYAAHPIVMNAEIHQALAWELGNFEPMISQDLREPLAWSRQFSPAQLDSAKKSFAIARQAFKKWLDDVDAVMTPSAVGEAPLGVKNTGSPEYNTLWTALNASCVSVPMGHGPSGLPLGIQIVCEEGRDAAALSWARWVQSRIS